jgi:hypothetical protein
LKNLEENTIFNVSDEGTIAEMIVLALILLSLLIELVRAIYKIQYFVRDYKSNFYGNMINQNESSKLDDHKIKFSRPNQVVDVNNYKPILLNNKNE